MESNRLSNSANLTDWLAERHYFGRFYHSQGLNSKGNFTNDCGPACLAMVINMLLFQSNMNAKFIDKNTVIRFGFPFWGHIPGWLPIIGGASTPWGMVKAFNRSSDALGLGWQAERHSHARRAHVLENLITGRPVTALKIWRTGKAHWVNLVRYSGEKDRIYFLDPNPYLENLPEDKRLQSQTWAEFEADWSREVWWSRVFGIRNEIIKYSKTY